MTTALATFLGAIVGAVASIIVCIINNNKQNALMCYRLDVLEKKFDNQNDISERVHILELRFDDLSKSILRRDANG